MARNPKVRLARLRNIGWTLWDPIGLLATDADWTGCGFADEYDTYLVKVAGMVRSGQPFEEIVEALIRMETVSMGLQPDPDMRARAEAVVRAIESDDQIWSD